MTSTSLPKRKSATGGTKYGARRLQEIPFSPIRQMLDRATALEGEGRSVIHLELGRPDFDTPEVIKAAAIESLERGNVHYGPSRGVAELREAIARRLTEKRNLTYDPTSEILVTSGLSEAVLDTFLAFLDPGDEVLVPDPFWPHYQHVARIAGARLVPVRTTPENRFVPDPEEIQSAITPRTRLLVINSPNNPTGAVYPREVLIEISELAAHHDLVAIADDIYGDLVYGVEHNSLAAIDGMRERTILLDGFSKAYSMTGWRLGYVAAPSALIDGILKVHQYNTVCSTTFAQAGGVAAITDAAPAAEKMRAGFAMRRSIVVDGLRAVPSVSLVEPHGAFYAFPRFEIPNVDSTSLAIQILDRGGVTTVPGDAFGVGGRKHLRLSYAASEQDIIEALARIKAVVEEILENERTDRPDRAAQPNR